MNKRVVIIGIALSVWLPVAPVTAQLGGPVPVIDHANLLPNTLSAARLLLQLLDMEANSLLVGGVWDGETEFLIRHLEGLLQQLLALGYSLPDPNGVFRETFPGYAPPEDYLTEYPVQVRTTLDTLGATLDVLKGRSDAFATEEQRLRELQALSDRAPGRMAAIQASNMFLSELGHQLMKLQQIMLTLTNAMTVAEGQKISQEAERDAAQDAWLQTPYAKPDVESFGYGPRSAPALSLFRR